MSKKKGETFEIESKTLREAKELGTGSDINLEKLQQAYVNICDEYEKLLDEAKFLTKVSDKLEARLNKANEELQVHYEKIAHEKENVEAAYDKTKKKASQLARENTEIEAGRNKLQMVLIFVIAGLLVVIVVFVWYTFVMKDDLRQALHEREKSAAGMKSLELKIQNLEQAQREAEEAKTAPKKPARQQARPAAPVHEEAPSESSE